MRIYQGPVAQPEPLRALLGHKGELWRWQIEQCLTRRLPGLESRFYVLEDDSGAPYANLCLNEHQGVGILGHVFTAPARRRQGAADRLLAAALQDFSLRDGYELWLGTEPSSPAAALYARHGFAELKPGSATMVYRRKTLRRSSPAQSRRFEWCYWPGLYGLDLETPEWTGLEWLHSGREVWLEVSLECDQPISVLPPPKTP